MILAALIAGFFLMKLIDRTVSISPKEIDSIYGSLFEKDRLAFNFYRNVVAPPLMRGTILFLSYLYLNLYILPRLMRRKKILTGIINILLLMLISGTTFSFSSYLEKEYLFFTGNDGQPATAHHMQAAALELVFKLYFYYGIYVFGREWIIHNLEKENLKKPYRILILNQILTVFLVYLVVLWLWLIFKIGWNNTFIVIYFFLIPPAIILFFTNLYWLFPSTSGEDLFSSRVIIRLLVSILLIDLPFCFVVYLKEKDNLVFPLTACQLSLLIVTPISWIVYSQRRNKILELRGLQTALGRTRADLQFLRSQINPHFLFNVLNTLYGTAIQENAALTAEGIQRLGDMMRFMLHDNHLEKISMDKEVEYIKNYIALQRLRVVSSPAIGIETVFDERPCNALVAPMLLIPFVENAFKHGISLQERSWIRLSLRCDEHTLYFDINNSLHIRQHTDTEKDRSGIGLENVRQRLALTYPGRHELHIHQSATEYFVHLTILF